MPTLAQTAFRRHGVDAVGFEIGGLAFEIRFRSVGATRDREQIVQFVDILDYGLCERLGRLLNRYREAEVI